ncbi:unnamed protein product [Protopolystoma xenopodis]|uniref:Fibronectin type-III domain-containing protein n=1 Tax=Protopolystoma xenopodis TaxID=117903 RepID=A0A3S5AMJ9_9PLAT|nr:unnamed protein product [Protopolystoma xenopodis]
MRTSMACCVYADIRGHATRPVSFTTAACEPAAPKPPTMVACTRNTISLKWSPPQADNGARIIAYRLEYARADMESPRWTEGFYGPQRFCKLQQLFSSNEYLIRLAAINIHGQRSGLLAISTCGPSAGFTISLFPHTKNVASTKRNY